MRKITPLRLSQGCHDSRCDGVTLLEMMIAMAIVLTLSALAVPTMTAIRMAKLREAGSDYASLLQNARVTAIQNDAYYAVVTAAGAPTEAFIDLNANGRLDQGEPDGTWLSVVANPSARVRVFKYSGSAWSAVQ